MFNERKGFCQINHDNNSTIQYGGIKTYINVSIEFLWVSFKFNNVN